MGRNLFSLTCLFICVRQFYRVDATFKYYNVTCVVENGSYKEGSVYEQNLDTLLSILSSQVSTRAFYNSTAGNVPSRIYGLYQCRGDVSQEVCGECIQDATQKIVKECPLVAEAAVWYEECMLRYANHSIFSVPETYPGYYAWSLTNISDYHQLAPVLATTLNSVINDAAQNSSRGHFATKAANWTRFDTIYCLAQCTPDLTDFDCRNCLTYARSIIVNYFNTTTQVRVYYTSCQLSYDTTHQFYKDISTKSPAHSPSNTSVTTDLGLTGPVIGGIVVGATAGVVLLVAGVWFYVRHQNKGKASSTTAGLSSQLPPANQMDNALLEKNPSTTPDLGEAEFVQYDFATLKAATRDFSTDVKLGEGGFGAVYMGTMSSGQQTAIKRLSGNSGQGAKEFMTEAQLVAKLQHRNLVRLLGFCSEGHEKLLVYEFLPNSSLDRFLFDPTKRSILDWEVRFKIIIGVARGIQYLHEDSRLTIIHRDLKPNNILLDKDMNPKIADFGLARLFEKEQTLANTTRIVGTYGYMAPEYMLTGDYCDKTDVYSFGIIVLELVSGKKSKILHRSSQREDLSIQAWKLWDVGRASEIIDPTLDYHVSKSEVMRCIQIGLLCVQQNALYRPTMAEVMLMLTGSIALPPPTTPEMFAQYFNLPSSSNDSGQKNEQSATKSSSAWYYDTDMDLCPR